MKHAPPPPVESLEARLFLSAVPTLSRKGKLTITGDDAPTQILILTPKKDQIQVVIDGQVVDPNAAAGPTDHVGRNRVQKIVVLCGAGNDYIQVGGDDPATPEVEKNQLHKQCTVVAGAGDDVIFGSPEGDVLIGGAGDDTISGGKGNDRIFANAGGDHVMGEVGKDLIFGQDGNDNLDGGPGVDSVYGLAGDDAVAGGKDDDFLNGGSGNDTLLDRNDRPRLGKRGDASNYMDRIIELGLPERYRAAAKEGTT